MKFRHAIPVVLLQVLTFSTARAADPSIDEIMNSKTDLLGEAALKQPGGPSYEFFADKLPPLRYCDADFMHYPITLSAPSSTVKARFVSNGSAINALARQHNWQGEAGIPFEFFVGDGHERFGSDLNRLNGPKFLGGYLPIVQLSYESGGATYGEEAFASVDPIFEKNAAVFVAFDLKKGDSGRIEAKFENKEYQLYKFDAKTGRLTTPDQKLLAILDGPWKYYPGRGALVADLKSGESVRLIILTDPVDPASASLKADTETFESQRKRCADAWNALLDSGTLVNTPEAVVNDAWRASVIGNFMLLKGDDMRYSQGNQYAKLYIAEGGDATRAAALWGHADDAKRMVTPLFRYTRKNLEFHQAALKLQMLAHVYRLTRDTAFLNQIRPLWEKEIDIILNGRKTDNGMLPREKYCGDIDTMVFSLNSNANCWRGLRDMSVVLAEINDPRAAELAQVAKDYRRIILEHLDKAIRRDVTPPFVPVALSGEEEPYDPIWGSIMGSYWNLMIEYILGSGIVPPESQTTTDIMNYLQQKGGLCMGMLRARSSPGWWVDGGRINDLYGTRYALTLLRRDEPDRALVSFYGKLAQGMTRDTFVGCEGSSIGSPDGLGRQMYLPPNSAANANYLQQLRYTLVQDYDVNDDGKADTLRLAFATPRKWLSDGKKIEVKRAPTEFGQVSYTIESRLKDGMVNIDLDLPKIAPDKTLLRLRLPDPMKVSSAKASGRELKVENGETIDLSGLSGNVRVLTQVKK